MQIKENGKLRTSAAVRVVVVTMAVKEAVKEVDGSLY